MSIHKHTQMCAQKLFLLFFLPAFFALDSLTYAQTIVEHTAIYSSITNTPFRTSAWNMSMTTAPGGMHPRSTCLWFNTDWKAKPWAGVNVKAREEPSFILTEEWIDKGFIRLYINVTLDRYGNIGGGDSYQIIPLTDNKKIKFQEMRSQFIDRGRGIDEVSTTWQEVLIPIKYFTELRSGDSINGFSFQTRNQVQRTFSLDEIAYIRFDTLPEWIEDQQNIEIIQDWVEWPTYDELPEVVKADRRPLSVRNGKFVCPDGSRAFMINPYCREDSRLAYGTKNPGQLHPTYNLYNREKHGWIYDEVPTTEHLCRLGFNSYSGFPVPTRWWRSVGFMKPYKEADDSYLANSLMKQMSLPFYVDLVSFPYTIGAPGNNTDKCNLPASAATIGRNHWTQYRIIGEGRKAWLKMWDINAQRYREAGAKTLIVELMNEPAYMGETSDHYAEFEQWLKTRYGSIEKINAVWHTEFKTLAEASSYKFTYHNTPDGQRLDYDEYLSTAFNTLIRAGVEIVNKNLKETLVGLQTMRGYMSTPHDSVWKYKLAEIESAVLTPTGGGNWTSGSGASTPATKLTSHPMSGAPLENDLLLACAGNKMIVDNETYLRGQTRLDTRNRLWEHVACGLDGLTVFSWSKRGWIWRKGRELVQTDADKYPYSSLIPIARRTDALRGILDFSIEVQTLAPKILPKPWGPEPAIGFLYSWDNARRRLVDASLYNKLPAYYTAMRNSHWNMCMLTADSVLDKEIPENIKVIVTGGLTHVEPDLATKIREFVKSGGILILGECDFTTDIYDNPLPENHHLAPVNINETKKENSTIILKNSAGMFPQEISAIAVQKTTLKEGTEIVIRNSKGEPVITKHKLGKGAVYHQAADLIGYSLAAILHEILYHAGDRNIPDNWRSVNITEHGHLAPNIIASRRSHPDHHVILLLNRDSYDRTIRIYIPGLTGEWKVTEALAKTKAQSMPTDGIEVKLPASGTAVLLLEK